MSIEATTGDIAQDGSVSIKVDGKTVKYVLGSDLGAVKSASEGKDTEISKLQASLATANTKYDTEHQETLKERAAKETAIADGKEGATFKTQVGELTIQVADLTKVGGEHKTKLTEQTRTRLVSGYKIDAEKVKDMTLEKLEETEQALVLTGIKPTPADYDGKGGSGGGSAGDLEGKSPLQLAAMGYAEKN